MPRTSGPLLLSLTTAALLLANSAPASSQSQLPAPRSRVLQAVDDARVTTLTGNTHPLARPEFDQGALRGHDIRLLQRVKEPEIREW